MSDYLWIVTNVTPNSEYYGMELQRATAPSITVAQTDAHAYAKHRIALAKDREPRLKLRIDILQVAHYHIQTFYQGGLPYEEHDDVY